jgi:DNA-binding response OmpR family regulator
MYSPRVLIVEDEALVALDVEGALSEAGWEVCGVSGSESEALKLAEATRPPFAVVDVRLSPGGGRIVARELSRRFGTAVLLATAHCDDKADLARTGAVACLPKPYRADDVAAAHPL